WSPAVPAEKTDQSVACAGEVEPRTLRYPAQLQARECLEPTWMQACSLPLREAAPPAADPVAYTLRRTGLAGRLHGQFGSPGDCHCNGIFTTIRAGTQAGGKFYPHLLETVRQWRAPGGCSQTGHQSRPHRQCARRAGEARG